MTPSQQSFTAFGATLIEAAGVEAVATLHAGMVATGLSALTCKPPHRDSPMSSSWTWRPTSAPMASAARSWKDGRRIAKTSSKFHRRFGTPHMLRILSDEIVDSTKPKKPAP